MDENIFEATESFFSQKKLDDDESISSSDDADDIKCRICWSKDNANSLISPCDCEGSIKYVHIHCLTEWIKKKHIKKLNLPNRWNNNNNNNIYNLNNINNNHNINNNGYYLKKSIKCELCQSNYFVKISSISWLSYINLILFKSNKNIHFKEITNIFFQFGWIVFQLYTLTLVVRSFYRSFKVMDINIKAMLKRMISKIGQLFGPFTLIKNMLLGFLEGIKNFTIQKMINKLGNFLLKIILFAKIVFLWMLIVQHTASITFNFKKLFAMLQKHKALLIKLDVLTEDD